MQQPVASTQELAQELVFREHKIALLQVEASMLAAELLRSGFLEDEGYNSPTDWLRSTAHLPTTSPPNGTTPASPRSDCRRRTTSCRMGETASRRRGLWPRRRR